MALKFNKVKHHDTNEPTKDFWFNGLRLKVICNQSLGILFLASDVAESLGLHVATISRYLKDNLRPKDYVTLSNGKGRPAYYVNESGFYDLVFKAKTTEALDFKYWVFDTVLPSIRKDGGYIAPDANIDQLILLQQQISSQLATIESLKSDNKKLSEQFHQVTMKERDTRLAGLNVLHSHSEDGSHDELEAAFKRQELRKQLT